MCRRNSVIVSVYLYVFSLDEAFDVARSDLVRERTITGTLLPLVEKVHAKDGGLHFTDKGKFVLFTCTLLVNTNIFFFLSTPVQNSVVTRDEHKLESEYVFFPESEWNFCYLD